MNPNSSKGKIFRVFLTLLFLGTFCLFLGRYLLYFKIRNTIEYELASLRNQGIHVTYENLEVYPWDGKIEVHELRLKVRKDSINGQSTDRGLNAYLPYVTLEGIDLFPFLKDKTLAIDKIHSFETYVTYRANSTLFENDKSQKRKIEVKNIEVNRISCPSIDFYLTDEKSNDTIAHILADVNMKELLLAKQLDSLTWQKGEVDVSNFAMSYKKDNYGFSLKKLRLDIASKSIEADSLLIKPLLPRARFMEAMGKQCSYVEAFIPRVSITSIDWYTYPTATLQVDRISMAINGSIYRDKRLPFVQLEDRPLPSHALHRLPIQLKIDTISIEDSYIGYEEMPESSDSTGLVYFEKLNATISNLHNNPKLKVDGRMHARARFMGEGKLDAHFTFPHDTLQLYRVAGTLKDLPLRKINKMLGAAAQAKVESGLMRNLRFEFTYNDVKSQGEVELNYEDLKILSLRENRKNEQSVSFFKTFLLNAFVVRKDMDQKVKDEKRRGEVSFYRDTKKSVFNFWWKSILSGVKSAYNLDRIPLNTVNGDKSKQKAKKKGRLKEALSRIFD